MDLNILTIAAISIALGADAFSLAIGVGLADLKRRELVRLPLIIAGFHVLMPLAGIVAGRLMGGLFGQVTNIFAGGVLILIGGIALVKSFLNAKTRTVTFRTAREAINKQEKMSRSLTGTFFIAFGVSIDAFSVGMSLGALGAQVLATVIFIGLTAGVMTIAGLLLGNYLGSRLGRWAETVGGLLLLLIGIKILM